jgi:energy-coupling factor transporter ATP-binding protein EcfA2
MENTMTATENTMEVNGESKFIKVKYNFWNKCSACGRSLTKTDSVWYLKGAGVRCAECGQHKAGEKKSNQNQLFAMMANAIQEHLNLNPQLDEVAITELIDKRVSEISPRPIEVTMGGKVTAVLSERVHKCFDEIINCINEGNSNVMIVGPAGSGKTTIGKQIAKALNLEFGFISLSAGVTEAHLFGRILPQADGSWQYVESNFVHVYEKGGVFLLDEVDAADANVMVAVNAALANGLFSNPVNGKVHHRHKDCIILAAANTFGRGGDMMYVGRNQLDTATLDRFVLNTVQMDYDKHLERALALSLLPEEKANELLGWIENLREKITANKLRRVASTRLVVNGAKAIANNKNLKDVKARYFVDWSIDEIKRVA